LPIARDHGPKTLGHELNFTGAEWRELRLRTIAPIDMTKEERDQDTGLRKRQRMRLKRRKEDRIPRAVYEANSLTRTKPWETLGMKRRTWYLHGKPTPSAPVAQVCAHESKNMRHTPVQWSKPNRRGTVVRQEILPRALPKADQG
jgi:hypothetical protein